MRGILMYMFDLDTRRLDDVVSARAAVRLRAFRRDMERLLPGRVSQVILFGSRARGEARRESDYDVAVVVAGPTEAAWRAMLDASHRHVLAGYRINPVALAPESFRTPTSSTLPVAIARDGVEVL